MAASKLDGAGAQKMKTLEEALLTIQSMHGMTERMAMDMKNQKSVGMLPQQVKRIAVPLQGQLKGQFGLLADQVAGMILAISRGGSDVVRLRTMRESIAQLRTAIEMSANKVKAQHSVEIEIAGD